MPRSKEHKQKSRKNILKNAIRLFSRKGFDKVSIDDVMRHAGMTRGAFYAHFDSKEDLYAHAIRSGPEQSAIVKEYFKGARGQPFIEKMIDDYLSQDHLCGKVSPCPLAFLVTDVANNSVKIRTVYTEVYASLVSLMNKESSTIDSKKNDDFMMAVTAMLVGGVAVSRALVDSDLTERLLASCRNVALQVVSD